MAGSIERYRTGIQLTNPILWDVKRVYPKEFKIGKYALELVCRHFGTGPQDAIAFGDSMNDAAMLEWAGMAVAMGNACEEWNALERPI